MADVSLLNQILDLAPTFERIATQCARMESVYLLSRNDGCILGSLASPLRFTRAGQVSLMWSDELTLRLSHRTIPLAISYSETGADGSVIDGIEYVNRQGRGCLKICRTDPVSKQQWAEMLSTCGKYRLPVDALDCIRKTNHLDGTCSQCSGHSRPVTLRTPSALTLEAFLRCAIDHRQQIEIIAPCGFSKARLQLRPQSLQWRGEWLIPVDAASCCHFRLAPGTHVVRREHSSRETLDIFDAGSRFVARLTKPNLAL